MKRNTRQADLIMNVSNNSKRQSKIITGTRSEKDKRYLRNLFFNKKNKNLGLLTGDKDTILNRLIVHTEYFYHITI